MESLKNFWNAYKGAIIGVIIALIIIITRLYHLVMAIILIVIGAVLGNYIQLNKYDVKEKLKNFIDRI